MKNTFCLLFISFIFCNLQAQVSLPELKITGDQPKFLKPLNSLNSKTSLNPFQPKKRKAVNSYIGAGYSFVIFTNSDLNKTYPVFDTRKGDFLSEINLYFGFAIAQAVTLEFEPSILFTHNDRTIRFDFGQPGITKGGNYYEYVFSTNLGLLALPLALNVRFFPLYKQTNSFIRLFFIGGGVGAAWIREEYDNYYTNDPNSPNYGDPFEIGETSSQWQPLFRVMTGFTGTGGQFGFGGELRYNIIPLSQEAMPFVTRAAKNFNSVDLTLRFYFSL